MAHLHRRTPSSATDLPPRSPGLLFGLRTPPTCPASPLMGPLGLAHGSAPGAAVLGGGPSTPLAGSGTSTPVRGGSRCVSTAALPLDVMPPPSSHVLSNLVGAVYESNFTAAQCYSAYPGRAPQPGLARLPAAPPLVGGLVDAAAANLNAAAATPEAAAAGIPLANAPSLTHGHFKPMGVSGGGAGAAAAAGGLSGEVGLVLSDIDDLNWGLASCLATPMDPGPGLDRRLAPIPAGATTGTATAARNAAAAQSAVNKLHGANDILNDASRYGDWVRRTRRRRKLEIMQGALAEISGAGGGGSPVLGRLIDDTLLPTTSTHTSSGGGARQSGGGRLRNSRGGAAGGAASASVGRGGSRGGALVPAAAAVPLATAAITAAPPAADPSSAAGTGTGGGDGGADDSPSRQAGAGAAAAAAAAAGHVAMHRPQVMVAAFSAVAELGEQEWELEVAEQQEVAAAGGAQAPGGWQWSWPGQPTRAQPVSASSSGPLGSRQAEKGLGAVAEEGAEEEPDEQPYPGGDDSYYEDDDDDVFGLGDNGFLGFRDDMALLG